MNLRQPTSDQVLAFARRAIAQLPDTLREQRADLAVLVKILPRHTEGRQAALAMLVALSLAEQTQQEFCFAKTKIKTNNQGGKI